MKAHLDYSNGKIIGIVDNTEIKIDIELTPEQINKIAAALGFIYIEPPVCTALLEKRINELEDAIIKAKHALSSVVSSMPQG